MTQNPYIDVLFTAFLTILFIIVASFGLATLARYIARWAGASKRKQENTFAGYLFAAPWIVGFLIFVIIPLGYSLYWSFTDYRVTENAPPNWIGLDNYVQLFSDTGFRSSIVNTLFLTAIGLPLMIGAALFLAVLLNQKTRGEHFFRMAFYLPVILGFNTAVLLSWRLMLNTGTGIVNQLIRAFSNAFPPFSYLNRAIIFVQELISAFFLGISSGKYTLFTRVLEAGLPAANRVPMWVENPLWTKMSVILLMVWGCGAMMLIFLTGLKHIPRELHDAAEW